MNRFMKSLLMLPVAAAMYGGVAQAREVREIRDPLSVESSALADKVDAADLKQNEVAQKAGQAQKQTAHEAIATGAVSGDERATGAAHASASKQVAARPESAKKPQDFLAETNSLITDRRVHAQTQAQQAAMSGAVDAVGDEQTTGSDGKSGAPGAAAHATAGKPTLHTEFAKFMAPLGTKMHLSANQAQQLGDAATPKDGDTDKQQRDSSGTSSSTASRGSGQGEKLHLSPQAQQEVRPEDGTDGREGKEIGTRDHAASSATTLGGDRAWAHQEHEFHTVGVMNSGLERAHLRTPDKFYH